MNGVQVIRALLIADSGVTDLVPATRIQADILPLDTPLPAILIEGISSVPSNTLPGGSSKFWRDRVQVTPNAVNYQDVAPITRAIIAACADKFPSVAGLVNVSVIVGSEGPEGFNADTSARVRPLDFFVTYNRTI